MAKVRKEYENQSGTLTLKGTMPVFDNNNDINLLNNIVIPGDIVKEDGEDTFSQSIQNRDGTIALNEDAVFTVTNLSYAAGASTSSKEKSVRWYNSGIYGITEPYDGMKILVKVPRAGVATAGVILNINGNTESTYHPVVYNLNTVLTTHYTVDGYKLFVYDASATMTAYLTAGSAETITGVWKGEFNYDTNTDTVVRQYQSGPSGAGTNGLYPILTRYNVTDKDGTYDASYARYYTQTYVDTSTGDIYAGGNKVATESWIASQGYASSGDLSIYALSSTVDNLNYASVGALSSGTVIPSTYGDVGAASAAHTHTYSDVGAASAGHNHNGTYLSNSTDITTALGYTPLSSAAAQVNADWSATTGVSSILNKPTLGTAASMASTAFLSSATVIPSTYTDVGAASAAHSHTYSEVGALSAATFIPSTYTDVGAMSAGKTFTYADVGALSSGTHIPSDPVNADWSATTGLSSIKNKPTLGTAASMASTAFRASTWTPTYADVGALSSSTFIPSVYGDVGAASAAHTHTYSDVGALSSATVIPSTYSDVGAASASHIHTDYVERTGDTMTGQLVAQNNIAYTTAQVRNVILSTSEPNSTDGGNGDIWIVYKE